MAVYFLAVMVTGLTFMGAASWVGDAFNGAALIVAVGISVWSGKRRRAMAGAVPRNEPPQPPGSESTDVAAAPQEGVAGQASTV